MTDLLNPLMADAVARRASLRAEVATTTPGTWLHADATRALADTEETIDLLTPPADRLLAEARAAAEHAERRGTPNRFALRRAYIDLLAATRAQR